MNTKGQSLLELILILPLLITIWAATFWFAKAMILSIELLHTARHGVFWLAYNTSDTMTPAQETQAVQQECRDFLRSQSPAWAREIHRVRITVQPGDRWQPIGPRHLADIPGVLRLMTQLKRLSRQAIGTLRIQPASVTVEYTLPAPILLRVIPNFPQTIPLRGFCVCYR